MCIGEDTTVREDGVMEAGQMISVLWDGMNQSQGKAA